MCGAIRLHRMIARSEMRVGHQPGLNFLETDPRVDALRVAIQGRSIGEAGSGGGGV